MPVEFKEKVSLEPLGTRVLIELLEEPQGPILLPETAKTKPPYGLVVACGESCQRRMLVMGKKVLYAPHAGMQVKTGGGGTYVVIDEDDLLAVVSDEVRPPA